MKARSITPLLSGKDLTKFTAKFVEGPVDTCWLWTGAYSNKSGYGAFCVSGKVYLAHRLAYMLHTREEPGTFLICHHCDNPSCVNPHHLFCGSSLDNTMDAKAKGRLATGDRHGSRLHPERRAYGDRNGSRLYPERLAWGDRNWMRLYPERRLRGEKNGSAKLTTSDILNIRSAYASGEGSHRELAARFGVAHTHIGYIIRREAWNHIETPLEAPKPAEAKK